LSSVKFSPIAHLDTFPPSALYYHPACFLIAFIWSQIIMRNLALLCLVLFVAAACSCNKIGTPSLSSDKNPAPKKVLIVTGQDHPGHKWPLTAPALAETLALDPRLQVTVLDNPAILAYPALFNYDVVVLHFMDWEQPDPGPQARANLQKCVADGKGLVLVHFACGAFQDWPEFVNLAGRVWDPDLRPHDPYGKFTVNITDTSHPITQQMHDFETVDELYTCLTGDPPIHILATARSKVDHKDYPMAFVLDYGRGRVFHTVLGHDVQAITNPPVSELLQRGCAWTVFLDPVVNKAK